MPIVTINKKTIHKYSEEELKDWIKYFNKHLANKAQNISANEENDGVTINGGIPIDAFEGEFIKDSLNFLNRLADKKINGSKIVNDYLRRHGEENKSVSKFPCQQCEYQANSADHLKDHVEGKHGTEKKYSCPQCDHKTKAKDYLRRHIRNKHKGIEYQCQECDYKACLLYTSDAADE